MTVPFWNQIKTTNTCWLWEGRIRNGYGTFGIKSAHRVVYEALVGKIPKGMQLDHLCKVTDCVNPAHLEPVTPQENNRRSNSLTAINSRKTHCKYGHDFTPENTFITKFDYRADRRTCLICKRRLCVETYWRYNTREQRNKNLRVFLS